MALFDTPGGLAIIPRDHYNRPLVTPPDGGKPKAYTRCTTYVDVLEDKFNLQQWELRQVALGLADRPDLLLSVSAHRDDKRSLNQITKQAKEAAKSSASATTGTATHMLCERVDRDQPLGIVPSGALADVDEYRRLTAGMEHRHIEEFTVNDQLQIGGTPDRVSLFAGEYYIVDIKTGKDIAWGACKIAMQLAVYAHSVIYYPATGERRPYEFELNTEWGIIIHLPAGQANGSLHYVNIADGWKAVQTAGEVRLWRAKKDWYQAIPTPRPPTTDPFAGIPGADEVEVLIESASTYDELRHVWTKAIAAGRWTDRHLELAKARRVELERAS